MSWINWTDLYVVVSDKLWDFDLVRVDGVVEILDSIEVLNLVFDF